MISVERKRVPNQRAIFFDGTKENFEQLKPTLEQIGFKEIEFINEEDGENTIDFFQDDEYGCIFTDDWLIFWKERGEWKWEFCDKNQFHEDYKEIK